MTTLTIRNVDPELREELRVRAARNGRSMEAELRHILKEALGAEKRRPEPNLAEAIRRRFLPLGGIDEIEPHPPCRSANRRGSSGDRPRHERSFGIDVLAARRGGLRLGRGAAAGCALYDERQQGRGVVWHRRSA